MFTTVCDICAGRIEERGHQLDLVQTRLVPNLDGRPRMIDRGSIRSVFLCDPCRQAVEGASQARQARRSTG
ncbi:MAG: hypothetical protein DK306_000047 [Chloroflexi bacterium]|nr:MAG: hypothetical protein DK306_000047 [Chloroflexota bacterium]